MTSGSLMNVSGDPLGMYHFQARSQETAREMGICYRPCLETREKGTSKGPSLAQLFLEFPGTDS